MPKPLPASSCCASSLAPPPLSVSRLSSSIVTDRFFSALSRSTFIGTVVPGLVAITISTSAFRPVTGLPLSSMITSPGSTPAFAPGPLPARS